MTPLLHRIIDVPFQWMKPGVPARVLSGPLRGRRWIISSSVKRCWLGTYERDKQNYLARFLRPGDVFYDVGAQAGYHSLLAAGKVGDRGKVYAFEPLPRNQDYLERHIELNRADNIEIVRCAVSDELGSVCFDPGPGPLAGRLSKDGPISVRTVSIDAFVADGGRPPHVLKIDVEGAEMRLLEGASNTLRRYHPALLIDTHDFLGGDSAGLHRRCLDYLSTLGGYHLRIIPARRYAGEIIATPER